MPQWIWTVIGLLAAFLTSTSFVPQLIVRLRNPRAARLSNATLGVFMAGVALWTLYGIRLGDVIIIGANIFIFLNLAAIALVQWYQERNSDSSS